tara:strand:- start:530 stop:925 length:396 start_codon:yes stop_codon:yes gene_type:complete
LLQPYFDSTCLVSVDDYVLVLGGKPIFISVTEGGSMVASQLRVFDPTAEDQVGSDDLANRLSTFDGKVLGLLNNTKDRTDVILNQIEEQLSDQFPNVDIRHYRKQSVSGMTPDIKEQLIEEVDALITATGD